MDSKKKCRQYSADYMKYGFVKSPYNEQFPMCLLCDQVFSNEGMKPSRMIVHLKSRHGDKSDNDAEFFKYLRDNRKTMGVMFGKVDKQNIDGLVASYNISLLIAKTGKPHTIGEKLILPAIQEVVTTVMHANGRSVVQSIPLLMSKIHYGTYLERRNFHFKSMNLHFKALKRYFLHMSASFKRESWLKKCSLLDRL